MIFKNKDIEVVNDNIVNVWVKGEKITFNLKNDSIRQDLEGMGVIHSDEEFEAYLIRAAHEYIIKGLHKQKRNKWIYDNTEEDYDFGLK